MARNTLAFSKSCSILYPLKTSENLWFSDVCRGYKMLQKVFKVCLTILGHHALKG